MTEHEIKISKLHSETKMNIINIYGAVRDFYTTLKGYTAKIDEISRSEAYAPDYKKTLVADLTARHRETALSLHDTLKSELEKMIVNESTANGIFDITNEKLLSALNIIKSSGSFLTDESRDNIIRHFKGDRASLSILKQATDNTGINTQAFDKYLPDVSLIVDNVCDSFSNAIAQPNKAEAMYYKGCKILSEYADSIGVDVNEEFANIGVTPEAYKEDLARSVMGLDSSNE